MSRGCVSDLRIRPASGGRTRLGDHRSGSGQRPHQLGALLAGLVLVLAAAAVCTKLVATQATRDRETAARSERLSMSRQIAATADRLAGKDSALAAQLAPAVPVG